MFKSCVHDLFIDFDHFLIGDSTISECNRFPLKVLGSTEECRKPYHLSYPTFFICSQSQMACISLPRKYLSLKMFVLLPLGSWPLSCLPLLDSINLSLLLLLN